jgi:PhoH-like ATPase
MVLNSEGSAVRTGVKIYVIDTSIVLFDASAPWNLDEHDVAIPLTVLEELDHFKKGDETINQQAREFIRRIDGLSLEKVLQLWIPLNGDGKGKMKVIHHRGSKGDFNEADIFFDKTADNRILSATLALKKEEPDRQVILLSQDINLRVKARAIGIDAEEYKKGMVGSETQLYTGRCIIEAPSAVAILQLKRESKVSPADLLDRAPVPNEYFMFRHPEASALAWFNPKTGLLELIEKKKVYGIEPKNAEQTFALHAAMNKDVPLVTILGKAGTGKTLLAMVAAIAQRKEFHQIYLARPLVPLSNKDIGYLPGDIKAKINPHMMPLWDNVTVIKRQHEEKSREFKAIDEMVENEKLHITPLAYIRGRSFSHIIFIVDEAQNLTPHEARTIVTRAGEGTKIIFTGDIKQIDTPYLNEQNNGLANIVAKMKGQPLYAHVSLEKGVRSDLAELASQLL